MSLVSCDPDWKEEARFNQLAREWREWYKVIMSTVADGPLEIYLALPKLQVYQPHPKDPSALVAEFYPQEIDRSIGAWLLELRYSTDVDVALNPLRVPASVTMDTQIREVPAVFDAHGNPIMNTAGQLMTDPPAVRKLVDQTISVTKNVPLNLPDWAFTHPGKVNSDAVRIRGQTFEPGTLFFARRSIGIEENVPGQTQSISALRGTPFTTIDFELWWREEGWVEYYPNRGWYQIAYKQRPKKFKGQEIKGSGEFRGTFTTPQQMRAAWNQLPAFQFQRITIGQPADFPPEPMFLDGLGQAILNPTFDDILLIRYDGYPKAEFGGLPFR